MFHVISEGATVAYLQYVSGLYGHTDANLRSRRPGTDNYYELEISNPAGTQLGIQSTLCGVFRYSGKAASFCYLRLAVSVSNE